MSTRWRERSVSQLQRFGVWSKFEENNAVRLDQIDEKENVPLQAECFIEQLTKVCLSVCLSPFRYDAIQLIVVPLEHRRTDDIYTMMQSNVMRCDKNNNQWYPNGRGERETEKEKAQVSIAGRFDLTEGKTRSNLFKSHQEMLTQFFVLRQRESFECECVCLFWNVYYRRRHREESKRERKKAWHRA